MRATHELIPGLSERYPRTTGLTPITPRWRDAPEAGLIAATHLLAAALGEPGRGLPG